MYSKLRAIQHELTLARNMLNWYMVNHPETYDYRIDVVKCLIDKMLSDIDDLEIGKESNKGSSL